MSVEMKSWSESAANLSFLVLVVSLFLLVLAHYGSPGRTITEPWASIFWSIGEVFVPVFLVSTAHLRYSRAEPKNPISAITSAIDDLRRGGLKSMIGAVVNFGIRIAIYFLIICVMNYIVTGRYNDGVDLVTGFMDMEWDGRSAAVAVVAALLWLHMGNCAGEGN